MANLKQSKPVINLTPYYEYVYQLDLDELRDEMQRLLQIEPWPGDDEVSMQIIASTHIYFDGRKMFRNEYEVWIYPNGWAQHKDIYTALFRAYLVYCLRANPALLKSE